MDPTTSGMAGFGSADVTSPFHYGSVHDGQYRSESLEQKLKKKYWKTKQTVIQKLGKNQDEFIVAGDADIDTKLEKAYHLQSSCTELLGALDKYVARLKTVSIQESVMGEHLRTWSETEYTNAGEVMQNVGKLQAKDSKARYEVIPPLLRMHGEFSVFRVSAIQDLNTSIQMLEKSRTEYRAALLWMKDVSEKLRNPDYKDQLIRFREAQAAVKETKRRFEKLKVDLGEKIDMVSASRCNLLSRSLPNYQKELLAYSDTIANDFHSLLVDLRNHHHHQYKVRRVLEEIRDLEAEELPFNDKSVQDEFSTLSIPELEAKRPLFDDEDDPLLDLSENPAKSEHEQEGGESKSADSDVNMEELKKKQTDGVQEPFRRVGDPFSFERVAEQAKVKDLVLGGIEAELKALQNEVVNPREPSAQSRSPMSSQNNPGGSGVALQKEDTGKKPQADTRNDDIDDLLQLGGADELDNPSLLDQPPEGSVTQQDNLVSEWNNFSAFMPATRDGTKSPLAGWEKELTGSPPPPVLSPVVVQDTALPASPLTFAQPEVQSSNQTDTSPSEQPPLSPSNPTPSDPTPISAAGTSASLSPAGAKDPTAIEDSSLTEDASIDKLLGISGDDTKAKDSSLASELLSEELQSLGITNSPPKTHTPVSSSERPPSSSSGLDAINPTLFQYHSVQPQYQAPVDANSALVPAGSQQVPPLFRSPLGTSQGPPVFPTQGTMGMGMAPPKFGLVSPMAQGSGGADNPPSAGQGMAGGMQRGKEEKKGNAWMNFFAHLDPLVNEKV